MKRQTVNALRDLDAYRATLSPAEQEVLEAWKSLLTNSVVESANARVSEIPEPYRESFLQAIRSREGTQSIEQIAEKRALQIMQQQDLQILTEKAVEVDVPWFWVGAGLGIYLLAKAATSGGFVLARFRY